ncbi:DNA-binding protein rdgB [Enterobacter asburiae]|uniref:DNA-binding protein rdgB n=1 Tax=Enterobacter asburiae TaxID=61645 RepID=A0A376FEW4_ENTAS|nr:DNA-binding protein rdgB [Enterobacter asburiae]
MSDLNQFRSKGPELLVELAQHTSETVREIIDIEPAVADQIGQAVANRMMQVWGGQNVYFPMGDGLEGQPARPGNLPGV